MKNQLFNVGLIVAVLLVLTIPVGARTLAALGGTIAAGQVAYGTATDTIGGSNGLTYDGDALIVRPDTNGEPGLLVEGPDGSGRELSGSATMNLDIVKNYGITLRDDVNSVAFMVAYTYGATSGAVNGTLVKPGSGVNSLTLIGNLHLDLDSDGYFYVHNTSLTTDGAISISFVFIS